jgi:hypothetical protein
LCDIQPSVYRIRAELMQNGIALAQAMSAAFAIGEKGINELSLISTAQVQPIDSSLINITIPPNSTQQYTWTGGAQCLYSGVGYSDGTDLVVNCADVTAPGQPCGTWAGKQVVCKQGIWVNKVDGLPANLPSIVTQGGAIQSGCVTPWQKQGVAPNQTVPYEPYFTNGQTSGMTPIPLMYCKNGLNSETPGTWMKCDHNGQNCVNWP